MHVKTGPAIIRIMANEGDGGGRRGGSGRELDISDFLDWHVYFSVEEGAKSALYSLVHAGDTVIDVGANIGETALELARRVGAPGRVIAFEPDPLVREKCRHNFALNAGLPLRLEPYALSDREESAQLHRVSDRNSGGNRILSPERVTPGAGTDSVTVRCLKLDEYARQNRLGPVAVIKIDVEGFEQRVLEGARVLIERDHPRLYIELDDGNLRAQGTSARTLVGRLESWGYQLHDARTGQRVREGSDFSGCHLDLVGSVPSPESSMSSDLT